MQMQILTLSLFISLEIDSLYGLQTQKNLHLHDQLSGWLRHCTKLSFKLLHIFAYIGYKGGLLKWLEWGQKRKWWDEEFFTPPFSRKTKFQLPRH